jgi:hypothetical protein
VCFYQMDRQLFRIWPQPILGKWENPFFVNFQNNEVF